MLHLRLAVAKHYIFFVFILLCCTHTKTSLAFKIDTHLWIGQQVINDLEDGYITVKLQGQNVNIAVPPAVKATILANKQEYLLGNIGPDAFPDVVAGQTVVHPGVSSGWKTNDWLVYLLKKSQGNPQGTAFAYGYLAHAASDVFAHTYVNQYAGDIFELRDETLVEQRHVALESFIGRRNPPFLDSAGRNLGAPYGLVTVSPALATFVRDSLVLDSASAGQYALGPATKYLPAYLAYRNKIESAANNPIWKKIDTAVVKVVGSYYGLPLTDAQAGAAVDFVNTKVIPAVQRRENIDQDTLNKLDGYATQFDSAHYAALNAAIREVSNLQSQLVTKLAERNVQAARLCTTVLTRVAQACPTICWPDPSFWNPFGTKCGPDPICKGYIEVQQRQCKFGEDAAAEAARVIAKIDAEVNGTNGLRDQMLRSATRLRDQAIQTKNSALALIQASKDMQQALSSNTSPAKAYLDTWKGHLDVAMREYVVAAGNSMLNTMNSAASSLGPYGAFTPMSNWFSCYHLSLAGTNVSCEFYRAFNQNWADLQRLARVLDEATSLGTYAGPAVGLPTPEEVHNAIDSLKAQALNELTRAGIRTVEDLLPADIRDIIKVLGTQVDETELRQYFTKTGSKNVLIIPDIDSRVKAEMFFNPTTKTYDPSKYAVVSNAVTLSKIALLDNTGLRQLATAAGVNVNDQNTALSGIDNLVANAFASIDGNHQWLTIAPPSTRKSPPFPTLALNGYPWTTGYASSSGFALWRPEVRDTLFRRLFIGPLSPGVDSPTELGLTTLLPDDYPYKPCFARPFPDGIQDKTCSVISFLPALFTILD